MANWKRRVDISNIWESDLPFTEFRDKIVDVLNKLDIHNEQYNKIIKDLKDSQFIDEFDEYWEQIYDWADQDNRLWIQTTQAF